MLGYVFKRIVWTIPTLLIIITLSFFLIKMAPGGPFDSEREIPIEITTNLENIYHLNEPLWKQYFHYLINISTGDFGPSFKYLDYDVTELIMQGFPISLQLGLFAIILALVIGITLGITAALRKNEWIDYLIMTLAMTGIAIPNFVMAPIMVLIFSIFLGWLPAGGWGEFRHMILPVITLSLPQMAIVARLTRASLIETLNEPYIRTAKAKGLSPIVILTRHASHATMLPILSWLGPASAAIITGSIVVEQIFGLPGIGRHFVNGALNRDYTLVMGVVIFYGVLIILINLLVDLLYAWLDPRIRY